MFCISVLYFLLYFWFDILLSNTVTFIFIYSAITRSGALSEMKDKKNSKCKKPDVQQRNHNFWSDAQVLIRCTGGGVLELEQDLVVSSHSPNKILFQLPAPKRLHTHQSFLLLFYSTH